VAKRTQVRRCWKLPGGRYLPSDENGLASPRSGEARPTGIRNRSSDSSHYCDCQRAARRQDGLTHDLACEEVICLSIFTILSTIDPRCLGQPHERNGRGRFRQSLQRLTGCRLSSCHRLPHKRTAAIGFRFAPEHPVGALILNLRCSRDSESVVLKAPTKFEKFPHFAVH
jgi:hypothetical protein